MSGSIVVHEAPRDAKSWVKITFGGSSIDIVDEMVVISYAHRECASIEARLLLCNAQILRSVMLLWFRGFISRVHHMGDPLLVEIEI